MADANSGQEDCGMRVDAKGVDDAAQQQQQQHVAHVAHVRLVDGDDHLRLQLRILNDRKTLFRPIAEKLDKIRYRLQILATNAAAEASATCSSTSSGKALVAQSLSRKANSAATKKKKKKTAGRPAEPQYPTMKVKVRFFDECGQEFLSKNLAIGDVLMHTARIEIGDVQYVVLRNQPLVLQLNVVDPMLAGIPVVPLPKTEFCHPDECKWTWFRIDEKQDTQAQCCSTRRYIPTKADIGCRFRIECHAPSMHLVYAEDSKTEVVTSTVVEGPRREVFRKRQLLGEVRAQNAHHGDAFRVMSYNILFDGYTTTDHAQQNLFPYANPSVVSETYRMQLVFQEIEECNADVICLQEMGEATYNSFFVPMMKPVGYHTFYSGKTGSTHEGCAVFVRSDCFDVLQEHTIDLSMTIKHSPDPAIKALLAEFPEVAKGFDKIPSVAQLLLLRSRRDPAKHLIVSNTHLFYREDADLIRLLQAVALVREVSKIRVDLGGHVALVLCGDFNAFPDTATVRFLLDARVDSTHRHWQEAPFFKWNRSLAKEGNENGKEHPKNHRVRCGCFEHQLQLVSGCGIPEFTNFAGTFVGTLDYVLVGTECLEIKQVFPFFTAEEVSRALPSKAIDRSSGDMEAPRLLSFAISAESLRENDDVTESSAGPRTRSIRKSVVARDPARRYGDQKSREETLKSRISRQSKQLAILEAYNRRKEAEKGERGSRDDDGGARGRPKSSSSAFPSSGAIIPHKGPTYFPRNASLRVLSSNQLDDVDNREHVSEDEEELRSPTEEDLQRFAALTKQPDQNDMVHAASPVKPKKGADAPLLQQLAPVLCELRATKEIVVREQTLKQLRQLVPMLNTIADELSGILQEKAAADAILSAAHTASPMREKRRSSSSFPMVVAPLSVRRPESGQSNLARAESQVKELSARFAVLAEKAQHRMEQFVTLVATLQEASMNAAEAIVEWWYFRQRRCRFTNFQPLYRFPWKKMEVTNYLTHMDEDLHFLFATAALRVALGSSEIAYNPLLLPRKLLDALGFADCNFVSSTFMTERRHDDNADARPGSASVDGGAAGSPEKMKLQYEALRAAMKLENGSTIKPPTINHDRARACLETIQQEKELELRETQKADDEKQRVAAAYNPSTRSKLSVASAKH